MFQNIVLFHLLEVFREYLEGVMSLGCPRESGHVEAKCGRVYRAGGKCVGMGAVALALVAMNFWVGPAKLMHVLKGYGTPKLSNAGLRAMSYKNRCKFAVPISVPHGAFELQMQCFNQGWRHGVFQ